MEWKYFVVISAYILTACDPVLGISIINVTLVDGQTPNEGSVEYIILDDSTWQSVCGAGFGSKDASVICTQLGYPGVNNLTANVVDQWHFVTDSSIGQYKLNCGGEEQNITGCPILVQSSCLEGGRGGVICYESGYTGCYTSALGAPQTPCENGVQDLTIPKCVSLCHHTSDTYTYAGLYQGNMCYCWSASTTVSSMDKVDDKLCSSPCVGRDIEKCGGDTQIALFNISLYLQNTKRTASRPGCANPTPTQTEGAVTTTMSSSTPTPSTLTSSTSSSLSSSSSSSPPPPSPQSASPPSSSPRPTSPSVPSTDHTTTEVMTSDVTPRTPTGMPATTTRTTQTGVQGNLGLYIGAGAGGGILLLIIIIILLVVFIIRCRCKVPTRTGENGPDPYMDLQPRPEECRTYQEMAITSTASSKKPGERRLPSSNLVHENQNIGQRASKIKEVADDEDVLTPN